MWRLQSMWVLIVILSIVPPAFTTCFTNLDIKGSLEECSFHYAADDQSCSQYQFTHCLYVNTTATKWLWIFSGEIKQELVKERDLGQCAKVCCKDESPLPTNLEGYQLCQHRKFLKERHMTNFLQTILQIGMAVFLLCMVASILYTCLQAAEEYFLRLRDNPQEIQMRMM